MHLAREFGFCYGVDRAVDYAYQTRQRFPDRARVPDRRDHPQPARQREAARHGHPVPERRPGAARARSAPDDVVILPAFGVTVAMLQQLERRGCTLIDTTCGSVLNVWKNVRRYAEGGYTSIIHGKVWHEETQATASQAVEYGGALSRRLRRAGDRASSATTSGTAATATRSSRASRSAVSPGFDPDRDLQRIGLANQTTMLMSESLEIGEMFKAAMVDRYGDATLWRRTSRRSTRSAAPPRTGRTRSSRCCASTPVDLMIVIGGYNSSNTCNLARICAAVAADLSHRRSRLPGVAAARSGIGRSGAKTERSRRGLAAAGGPVSVGLTSGASTPDNLVGAAIAKLDRVLRTDAVDCVTNRLARVRCRRYRLPVWPGCDNSTQSPGLTKRIAGADRISSSSVSRVRSLRMRLPMTVAACRRSASGAVCSRCRCAVAGRPPSRFAWWKSEPFKKELGLTADQVGAHRRASSRRRCPSCGRQKDELDRLEAKLSRLIETDADEAAVARQIDRVETARASAEQDADADAAAACARC